MISVNNENNLITPKIQLEDSLTRQQEAAASSVSASPSTKASFRKFAAENRPLFISVPQDQEERSWEEIFKEFQDLSKPLKLSDQETDRILAFYGISDINERGPKEVKQLEYVENKGGFYNLDLRESLWDGLNPLENAVLTDNAPLVRLLLSKGASPYAERKYSGSNFIHLVSGFNTALCNAIHLQNLAVIQQFANAGIDPNVKVAGQMDWYRGVAAPHWVRRTALEFAKDIGNDAVVALLLETYKKASEN